MRLREFVNAKDAIIMTSPPDLVLNAVRTALAQYPDAWLYAVILATLASSGFVVVKYLEHIVLTGLSKPFTIPHHSTKTMFLGACFLVAQIKGVLPLSLNDLFTGLVLSAFVFRITTTYFLTLKVKEKFTEQFILKVISNFILFTTRERETRGLNLFFNSELFSEVVKKKNH